MNPFKIGLAIVFMGGFAYGIITLSFQNSKLESQLDIARNYQSQLNEQTNVNIRRLLEFEEQLGKLKSQLLSATSQLTSLSAELEEAKQQSNPSYEALLEKARMEIASGTPRQLQPQRFANAFVCKSRHSSSYGSRLCSKNV